MVTEGTKCISCERTPVDVDETGGVCEACQGDLLATALLSTRFRGEWAARHSDREKRPPNFESPAAFVEASVQAGEAIVTLGGGVAMELLVALEVQAALEARFPAARTMTGSDFLECLRTRFAESGPAGRYCAFMARRGAAERIAEIANDLHPGDAAELRKLGVLETER